MKYTFKECLPVTVQIYTSGQNKICNLFNILLKKPRGFVSKMTLKIHEN